MIVISHRVLGVCIQHEGVDLVGEFNLSRSMQLKTLLIKIIYQIYHNAISPFLKLGYIHHYFQVADLTSQKCL